MNYEEVIKKLKALKNPENIEGMARFGIRPKSEILGISIWELRKLKKEIGVDHKLAQKLWTTGIHEARILASFIEDPTLVTEKQLDKWVADFDSWDIVDQVSELIAHTPFVLKKIREWSNREGEYVKRAAFSLIAELAWWEKKMSDRDFKKFFPIIIKASTDERNFVKKAVNWALRNIGKRNRILNEQAINVAKELAEFENKTARWIAKDALRELTSEKVQTRLVFKDK
ncbi:DNA alkylation repair protein [Candidatus Woesebacteria bacterium RIFCSPLOWO2_01_FULL_37_19]|uniref:DNA alkylation repair protein n=1 Tax=Candidatus Woesebacteria bacterium RIFCSPLOWO2_01_FULL_37_19 TaxID=1802514 RepID=A0A1F8AZQ6_9BACT|nr:MAG: DNA alkylation repair protein [Candidatus Woesebacteria bacterium RIFCSPLOWO2_01_FULL_37_19]